MNKRWAINVFILLNMVLLSAAQAQTLLAKTQWLEKIEINSIINATVKSIKVKKGQSVKKGDVLLVMDQTILKLDYALAQAQTASKSPAKEQAALDYNRALELFDRDLISDVTLKQAQFKLSLAQAQYDAASAKQDKIKFLIDAAIIKSPISGRVLNIYVNEGLSVDNNDFTRLMTLVPDDVMAAVAHLKVSQWSSTLVGQSVTVLMNQKHYKGRVESLGLSPIENDKGLSIYPIIVKFKPKQLVPAGMPLSIEIP